MFDDQLQRLKQQVQGTSLAAGYDSLEALTRNTVKKMNQGDFPRWKIAFDSLPNISSDQIELNQNAITVKGLPAEEQLAQLKSQLEALIPWRKGPFSLFGVDIDAEWRSDIKWQRLAKQLPVLEGRAVLDVGCGNGYYLMKMAAHHPQVLLGIEPGILQNVQFWAIQKYAQTMATLLPLKIQQMPKNFPYFDVVFSMGVLYHRKSPIEHLEHLRHLLQPKGELVLETLVVEGHEQTCLVPGERYAQMRNVWFLPSVDMLCKWLKRLGMKSITVIDESDTTTDEQRTTEWMKFHSLQNFLDKETGKTNEGYPPPRRAIIRCHK